MLPVVPTGMLALAHYVERLVEDGTVASEESPEDFGKDRKFSEGRQKDFGSTAEGLGRSSKSVRKSSEEDGDDDFGQGKQIKELKSQILDLKITNKGKDYFIEQLQGERKGMLNQLTQQSRSIGRLETQLLQLEGPKKERNREDIQAGSVESGRENLGEEEVAGDPPQETAFRKNVDVEESPEDP